MNLKKGDKVVIVSRKFSHKFPIHTYGTIGVDLKSFEIPYKVNGLLDGKYTNQWVHREDVIIQKESNFDKIYLRLKS